MPVEVYDTPFNEVEQSAADLVTEAADLWKGEGGDPAGPLPALSSTAGPQELRDYLMRLRQRLDRIDGIQAKLRMMQGRLARMKVEYQGEQEDAWNSFNQAARQSATRRAPEYEGPRERYADADLATIALRRRVREVDRVTAAVNAAYGYVDKASRNLEGRRQEALAFYRGQHLESGLER